MNKRPVLFVMYIVMLQLFCGCGVTTLAQKNMERDLINLQEKVDSLEKNYEIQLNKTIEDAVKEVDATYKNSLEVALKNQASISSDLETIRIDFRRVKGDVEEIAHKAEKFLKEDKGKIDDYDMRLRELELDVAKINGKLETLENNQKLFTTLFSSGAKTPSVETVPHLTSVIPGGEAEDTGSKEGEATTEGDDTSASLETEAASTTGEAPSGEGAAASTVIAPEGGDVTASVSAETAAAATAVTETKEEEEKIPEEVQKAYDEAYDMFKTERFDDALSMFKDFSTKYPETKITDNAQYWIAECYYKKKEFDKAILEYDKMVANYPESDKVPSALLKEGFSFLQLDYKDEAIIKLKKLIEDYPDTNQAEIARRKLKVIK